MKMKKWNAYALMTILAAAVGLSGCQGAKRVPDVNALMKLGNEKASKKLAGFTRDDITDAWGDPEYVMQFGNGDLFIRGETDECLCVYYEDDRSTVKSVSVNIHGGVQEFTGVIEEDFEQSAIAAIDEGYPIGSSGTKVTVDLGEGENVLNVEVGDHVYVTYIGPVMESMPLQLQDQIQISVIDSASAFEDVDDALEDRELDGVTLSIHDVTPVSATVRVLNETDLEINYGEDYGLQMYEDGEWHDVPYLIDNWAFIAIAYSTSKGVPSEWKVNWEVFHGALKPGKYRLAKAVTDFRGTGDFTDYMYFLEFDIPEETK